MRKIFMTGISLWLFSCDTAKTIPANADKIVFTAGCQAGVTCTGTIRQSTHIEISANEEEAYNYKLAEDDNTSVFILSFDRDIPKNVQDGQYREELVFEVPKGKMPVRMKLDVSSKAVFGRFCYCKGSTGYYPINSGQLDIQMEGGQIKGHVSFQITKVPQVWKEASFLIQ